eukprot:3735776-Pyramimonas_sp.AAC.1
MAGTAILNVTKSQSGAAAAVRDQHRLHHEARCPPIVIDMRRGNRSEPSLHQLSSPAGSRLLKVGGSARCEVSR